MRLPRFQTALRMLPAWLALGLMVAVTTPSSVTPGERGKVTVSAADIGLPAVASQARVHRAPLVRLSLLRFSAVIGAEAARVNGILTSPKAVVRRTAALGQGSVSRWRQESWPLRC